MVSKVLVLVNLKPQSDFWQHRASRSLRQQKVKVLEVPWKCPGGTFPGFQAARASSYPPHYSSLEQCLPD